MAKKNYVLRENELKALLKVSLELPDSFTISYRQMEGDSNIWAVTVQAPAETLAVIGSEFRKLGKQTCPFCPSEHVTIGKIDTDGKEEPITYLVRSVQCNECHKTWDEFFGLDFIYYLD